MCYKGKCLYCIPVEHGCLALAIISAIGTGLAVLASVITGLLAVAGVIFTTREIRNGAADDYFGHDPDQWNTHDSRVIGETMVAFAGIAVGIAIAIIGLASLIAFIFSVLLCNGICKRRPGQVKAYFVYGVVITVLATLAAVGQLCTSSDAAPGILGLLGCVIYSLFLVLVHQTYVKLLEGAVFKDHVRLVES